MAADTEYKPVEALTSTSASGAGAAPAKAGLWTRFTDKVPFLKTKKGLIITIIAILVIIGGGLAGLAALPNRRGTTGSNGSTGSGGGSSQNAISNDDYFFGQSPPVYPARKYGLDFGMRPLCCRRREKTNLADAMTDTSQ